VTTALSGNPTAVADGVFFTDPGPLPRGRHALPRERVLSAQRERLLAAATELLAAGGYRGFGPGEVATRAGVSLAAFYECFPNKEACIFAGYERFIEVLLQRMTAVDLEGMDPPQITRALVGAYLDTLQSDLVVGRAYQVEIDALGPRARERRRNSLELFATYIREVTAWASPDGQPSEHIPPSAYIGVVYAVRQLASDALDRAPEPDLVKLGEEFSVWISDLFRER
jgi:AcrR family transcriptional regulator